MKYTKNNENYRVYNPFCSISAFWKKLSRFLPLKNRLKSLKKPLTIYEKPLKSMKQRLNFMKYMNLGKCFQLISEKILVMGIFSCIKSFLLDFSVLKKVWAIFYMKNKTFLMQFQRFSKKFGWIFAIPPGPPTINCQLSYDNFNYFMEN